MTKAILFGSIGTLVETSELHRQCFNDAFADAGLDWHWDQATYRGLLRKPGGARRIAAFAAETGHAVDAEGLYAAKSALFRDRVQGRVIPRSGVIDTVNAALGMNMPLAFVTTTARENVDAVLAALSPTIHRGIFAFVGDASDVAAPKPAPDIYALALDRLGVHPEEAVAIEDNPVGARAAMAAGIPTIAFPGAVHASHRFPGAEVRVDTLRPALFSLGYEISDDTLRAAVA